jgi:hypothetical protein
MIRFFMDELRKVAGDEPETRFQRFVHHPLIQGIGYGALAGEGAHALAERETFGQGAKAWAHRPVGKAIGTGMMGTSAAFLGAEGVAALQNLWKRKPAPLQKEAALPMRTLLTNLAIKGLEGLVSGGAGALAGWQVARLIGKERKKQ